jgi:hypothetical protein
VLLVYIRLHTQSISNKKNACKQIAGVFLLLY